MTGSGPLDTTTATLVPGFTDSPAGGSVLMMSSFFTLSS